MKKKTFLLPALIFSFAVLSACGSKAETAPATVKPVEAAAPVTEPATAEPGAEPAPDMVEAHEDVMGDMDIYNTYYDEENELLLSYPNVFAPEGKPDEDGYMRFPSLQTEGSELVYWVTPNTYKESPVDFMERLGLDEMMELEGNAVIGKMEDMDQETGEYTLSVCFWVVDTERIVNVSINCDMPEYAAIIYEELQNYAVFIESVVG